MIETVDEYIDRIQQHVKGRVKLDNVRRKEIDKDCYTILALGMSTFIAAAWWGFV